MPSSSSPSTTLRITGAVALYKCTIARGTPCSASKVRRIKGSRACVSTWIVTSSGMRLSSISLRTKSNSTCEAEGKPTSISLKPIFTSASNMRILRAMSMGSISAWLPSRRSTLHHTGGLVSTASGHVRSVRRMGAKGRYLLAGFFNIGMIGSLFGWVNQQPQKKTARCWCKRAVIREFNCARALPSPPVGG